MVEKKVYDLKIDPEFEELVAKPSEAEQAVLCESLDKYGCMDELTVWHGFILDGHTRYRHCKEKGISFSYREMEFDSKEEAKLWILELSLGRRSLTKYQRTKLALRYEAVWKEEAEKRMKEGKDPVHHGAQGSEKGRTRDKIAAMAGVSHKYVDQVKRLEADADEETKAKLERDEISVNKAISALKAKAVIAKEQEDAEEELSGEMEDALEAKDEPTDEREDEKPFDYGFDGKRHTGNLLADIPESFPEIFNEFELMMNTHLDNVRICCEHYTNGMHTPDNNKTLMKLIKKTNR
ncbi:MAG: hypothetical protein IIZ39_01225, partial [Blautia sp.]|nr:hypothetical protein [Blautia sp.]